MEYGITFLAAVFLYWAFSHINPISRGFIQQTVLLKYRERGVVKYKLVHSKKKVLKELIYNRNLDHVDIEHKIEVMFFFNRNYELKSYDGHHIRNAREEAFEEILQNVKCSFFDVYNNYATKRFVSFVRGEYYEEEATDE